MSTQSAQRLLADQHFRHWQSLFEQLTGIQLSTEREEFVRSVLHSRVVERGAPSLASYLLDLASARADTCGEWDTLIDKIVIGETRFFRHGASYDFARRFAGEWCRRKDGGTARFHCWSLGCSTGEQVYSLAMVLYRVLKGAARAVDFSVLGTDINRASLQVAERGMYSRPEARGLDLRSAGAFVEVHKDGAVRFREFLRSRVTFAYRNMVAPPADSEADTYHLINCHNVLIYLDRSKRQQVVDQLATMLRVGGVMLVGPGELTGVTPANTERVADHRVQAFRRVA